MKKKFFHRRLVLIPENVDRVMHAPANQFIYLDHVVQKFFVLLKCLPHWPKIA